MSDVKMQVLEQIDGADNQGQETHVLELVEHLNVSTEEIAEALGELLEEGLIETTDGMNYTLVGREEDDEPEPWES